LGSNKKKDRRITAFKDKGKSYFIRNYGDYLKVIPEIINHLIPIRRLEEMIIHFPTIHTNFWDAVIAVPLVLVVTQMIKIFLKTPKKFIPTLALVIGLLISIFISHPNNLIAGLFMGWFYGYAAIGSYASLKTTIISFRQKYQ
jgi:hypothetical protein